MKKHIVIILTFSLFAISGYSQQNSQPLNLLYNQPSKIWEEALPLGNGITGAMVFGGINKEQYALNDHTLWSGGPIPGNQPKGPEMLAKVREAIFAGDYLKGAELWKGMHGPYSARYLTMGDLLLNFDFADTTVENYSRTLDLRKALSTVEFTKDKIGYKRESFISFPDQVMVVRLTASEKKKISFNALLSSKLHFTVRVEAPGYLVLSGKAPKYVAHRAEEKQQIVYDEPGGEGMTFEIHLKIIPKGGQLVSTGNSIGVKDADEVTLLMTEATSFNGFDKSPGFEGKNPSQLATQKISGAATLTYNQLLNRHLRDYQNLFGRVDLNLGQQLTDVPTDERMLLYNKGASDNGLVSLYFQYGRYLMIASSRPGSPPSNLQGIWNQHIQPPWGSNYTTNINTEMNYWPAEVTNLTECHQPLFDFLEGLAINGAVTAKVNYGIQSGWLAHHNSDIWAKTSPTGGGDWDPRGAPRWSAWPMGGAWFCQHLWEHFLYTGDRNFLEKKAWPLMKGAAEFCLNWMVADKDGLLVTNPGSSPENVFKIDGKSYEIAMATTMDMSIIRELFANCLQVSKQLDVDKEFVNRIEKALPKLYPFHIGRYGQIQEWFKDWDDPKDKHRHISHLFSLYPGNQITPEYAPELAKAAKQTLIHRGDVSTGWSMAWKVNWWARLKDGDHALKILKDGLKYIGSKTEVLGGGGSYSNLFCACPPFQIDGNFGATAGIAEMLMQSHEGFIHLLPALPKEWASGEIKGLVARGGFVIDLKWSNGKLTEAIVFSRLGGTCRIKTAENPTCKEAQISVVSGTNINPLQHPPSQVTFVNKSNAQPVELIFPSGKVYELKTETGKVYHLKTK
jgi:alpha-L-fucosidase 2